MKRPQAFLSQLPAAFLIASLALPPQSAWALRGESAQQASGLEELVAQLAVSFKPAANTGLEKLSRPSEIKIPSAVQHQIQRAVESAIGGYAGLNQVVMSSTISGEVVLRIGVSVEGLREDPYDPLVMMRQFNPTPVIPDPRQINPSWTGYTSEINISETDRMTVARSERVGEMIEALQQVSHLPDGDWTAGQARQVLSAIRTLLEDPREGLGPRERVQQWVDETDSGSRREAGEVAQRTEQEQMEAISAISQAVARIQTDVNDEGGVPVQSIRREIQTLLPQVEAWPRTQAALRIHLNGFPPEGNASFFQQQYFFAFAPDMIRRESRTRLQRLGVASRLGRSYHDRQRIVWLERLPVLENALPPAPDDFVDSVTAWEIYWLGVAAGRAEFEETVSWKAIPQKAVSLGSAGRKISNIPFAGAGFLRVTPNGEITFHPGGGVFTSTPISSVIRFSLARVREVYQEGDRLVLVLPSYTGLPSLHQLDGYLESWLNLAINLPGYPEIWLGAATEEGALRLFRPNVSSGDPSNVWDRMKDAWMEVSFPYDKILGALRKAYMEWPKKPTGKSRMGSLADLGRWNRYVEEMRLQWRRTTLEFLPMLRKRLIDLKVPPEDGEQILSILKKRYGKEMEALRKIRKYEDLHGEKAFQMEFRHIGELVAPILHTTVDLLGEQRARALMQASWMFDEIPLAGGENAEGTGGDVKEKMAAKLREFLDSDRLRQNQLGRLEEMEPFARDWMRRQAAVGTDPDDIRFSDFKRAWKQQLNAHKAEQSQLAADVSRFRKDAATLAARPDALDAETMVLMERFNALWGRASADQRISLTAAAQPAAERLARIGLQLSWAEALPWDEIAGRGESMAAARIPASAGNGSANARFSEREIRKQEQRAMIAAIQGKKAAAPSAESEVKPAAATSVLEQEQARLFDQRGSRSTQIIGLLAEFPDLRQPLEEERRTVRSVWTAIELRRLAKAPQVSVEEIRESLDRINRYSLELDPDLKENYDVPARPVAERFSETVSREVDAALATTAEAQDPDKAGAALAQISEKLREDRQRVAFYRDLAERIEDQKIRIRDARETVDALKRMNPLAESLHAADGANLQSELARSAKLLRGASPAWKGWLVSARRMLAERYEGQVTAHARQFRETGQKRFGPMEAGELFPQISFALSALSEFPELADRSAYLRESRSALLRIALQRPVSLQAGAQFILAESAFQTVLKQEHRNGIGRFLEAAASGGTVPDLAPVEGYAERARNHAQGATRDFYDGVLRLIQLAKATPNPASPGASAAGLEEKASGKNYREGIERVWAEMERLGVKTALTPGEVWMLGRLADPDGYLVLGALDQKLDQWMTPIGLGLNNAGSLDVQVRMAIAARLRGELISHQKKAPWRQGREDYAGDMGFLFGPNVISHPDFSELRNGSVSFLAQGDNPEIPRWKPAQVEMTVGEAIAAGAVGYKTSVMLPALLKDSGYSPHWNRLLGQNLAWVRERAGEARAVGEGNGFGYVAGAILWPAPPADFIPPQEALDRVGRTADALRQEMEKDEPAEWALQVVTESWLESKRKQEEEKGKEFASAHAELTRQVVEEWSRTPGVTLLQLAGPYFVSRPEELTERSGPAQEAIRELAAIPGVRGKIIPATRNRPMPVYQQESTWMAEAGVSSGVTVGRSLFSGLVSPRKSKFEGKFYPMNSVQFSQGIRFAVARLLGGIDTLREKKSPGVWSAYNIPGDQAQRLITVARSTTAGLEETSWVQEPVRFIADTGEKGVPGVLEVAVMAARMRAAGFEQVEFSAVATEQELADARAGLEDPVAREILAAHTFTYQAGLEGSHAFALKMAQEMVPDPQRVISELNQATLVWFRGVAERLGVLELYQQFRSRVEGLLQAA